MQINEINKHKIQKLSKFHNLFSSQLSSQTIKISKIQSSHSKIPNYKFSLFQIVEEYQKKTNLQKKVKLQMGNEQIQNNCFTPRHMKQKYHSDVIQKRNKEANFDKEESIQTSRRKVQKENNLTKSISNLPIVKSNQDSITIEIKINLNGNQNYNIESIQQQIPRIIQSQGLSTSLRIVPSVIHQHSQNSQKLKGSVKTADQEQSLNIQDLDLPSQTSFCGSEIHETITN